MKNKLFLLLIIMTASSLVFSQSVEEISTDRPDQTESPDILPHKFIQFESGLLFATDNDGNGLKTDYYAIPQLLIRYGIYKNIELRAAFEYSAENFSESGLKEEYFGFQPLVISTKINLFGEKFLIPKTSFILKAAIPGTSGAKYEIKRVTSGLVFLFSNTLSDNAELSYNLGINWNADDETKTGLYSVSFGFSLLPKTTFFVESYGYFTDGVSPDLRIDYGAVFAPSKNIQFDIASGIGLTDISPDFFIGAGFSIRLPE